jgi:hypothetical protein
MNVIRYLNRTGLILGLLLTTLTASMASIRVEVNGLTLHSGVPAMQVNGRTMVPLRGIFESLGARVDWDGASNTITATNHDTNVQLSVGQTNAFVNGRTVSLDVPAMMLHRTTMVPLRFVSEALGADVKWFEATQTVSITSGHRADKAISRLPNDEVVQHSSSTAYQQSSTVEMRNLLAPIALYPDPLLAIMLPASTYPDQINEAERMHLGNDARAIDRQNWDISVKSLAHYPSLLRKLGDEPNWTASLGQVYVQHPREVMDAIQVLRHQARANGVLWSVGQQRVYLEGDAVRIVPAQATLIYVPQYDPHVVFAENQPGHHLNLLTFGDGLVIGSWLNNDTDWTHHRVYNHGWHGGGWIANSRLHVTINDLYIANRDNPATVNPHLLDRQ